MSIAAGVRLGPYEMLALIGAGGMGQVYRARDTRLERDVAIKVLPELFARDAERVARFEREAKMLAALNHPHIAQIHGVEESGGVLALVMEFVDGEDLAERLRRGPMPIDEALAAATQIAEALEAAHDKGILHRDLKPSNVKITPDGAVKILDFGLAKAFGPGGSGAMPDAVSSPTITSPATQIGTILGTAAYMAPEQAKGKAVDTRADIWAFGVVLFEMLTGRRAFPGDDVSETLASVLAREIDCSALPPTTPPHIRMLLRACLRKDPRQRLRHIGDARLQLEAGAGDAAVGPVAERRTRAAFIPWGIAAAALLAAVAVALFALRPPATEQTGTIAFSLPAPEIGEERDSIVLSPDGSFVIYSTDRLYIRRLSEFAATPLPGTENADSPFISPDGRWVGFFADGRIKRIAVAGGYPLDVCRTGPISPGAGWGADNRIYFTRAFYDAGLVSVSANGGEVTAASSLDRTRRERGHWWPHALPDGRHVLFTIWYAAAGLSEAKIGLLDLQTGKHRVLFPGAGARYGAGHVLYYDAGAYKLVPFDLASLSTTGDSKVVLHDALGLKPEGSIASRVSLSTNGIVAYMAGRLYHDVEFTWVGRDGRLEPTGVRTGIYGKADLSPDGRRVALGRPQGGTVQVLIADLGGGEQRLSAAGMNYGPVWHPDGQQVAFTSMHKGDFDIHVQRTDGSAGQALREGDNDEEPVAWLPSGERLVIVVSGADGTDSLLLLDPKRNTTVELVTGAFRKETSRVSPDGKWLAVLANGSGSWQVHVLPVGGARSFQQVSSGNVVATAGLRWSPRREEHRLFFVRDWKLVSVTLQERDGRVLPGKEEVHAPLPRDTTLVGVSPDGGRVLVATPVAGPSEVPPGIRIVVNGLHNLGNEPGISRD